MEFKINEPINVDLLKWRKKRINPVKGIYKITSPNGRIYIGYSKDIENRLYKYRILDCKLQIGIYNSLCKHGYENHTFEILLIYDLDLETEEEILSYLKEKEKEYISIFDSFYGNNKNGLNLTTGGEGFILSDEAKKRIGDAHRGVKMPEDLKERLRIINTGRKHTNEAKELISQSSLNRSDEIKKQMSELHKGNKYNVGKKTKESTKEKLRIASTGKKHTEESKKKISEKNKGRKMKPETKEKLRNINLGKVRSEESKKKTSESLKGRPAHNKGIPMSQEQKFKISQANMGRVVTPETREKLRIANSPKKK